MRAGPWARVPWWVGIAVGVLLLLFALLGITNSVHASAKVFYAVLTLVALLTVGASFRRRSISRGLGRGGR